MEIDYDQARRNWAFRPASKVPPPAIENSAWAKNGIDRFILAVHQEDGPNQVVFDGIDFCEVGNDAHGEAVDDFARNGVDYNYGVIFLEGNDGEVVFVEASHERENEVLGRFEAIEGKTWNNIALYGSHLLVRNSEMAACYELPTSRP